MPTVVAVLTLVALLKLANVDMPRWHLAFWFGVLVGAALMGHMPRLHAVWHGLLSFVQAWVYFVLLDRTDNRLDRVWHWLILIGGFGLIIMARMLIDIRAYGISF